MARVGVYQFGVSVRLADGREATWDSDGTAALEAQVMRNGMLVGYVPVIEGSDSYTEEQVIDAILRTDYDKPIASRRRRRPRPRRPCPRGAGSSAGSWTASATAKNATLVSRRTHARTFRPGGGTRPSARDRARAAWDRDDHGSRLTGSCSTIRRERHRPNSGSRSAHS